MKQHQYRVTLDYLSGPNGEPAEQAPLIFKVGNHDNIVDIVTRMRQRGDFSQDSATAFGVGLKLFSEVMLENKDHPLFAEFKPHFMQFMKALKKGTEKPQR